MKNLCRKGKVQVYPSPNPAACRDAYSVLRLLPVAIAALSAALQAEDREVLAYFIARSLDVPDKETRKNRRGGGGGGAASRKSATGRHGEVDEEEGVPPWGGGGGAAAVRLAESETFLQRSPSSSVKRKEVKNTRKAAPAQRNHPASFECSCFQCYMSFWSRWDASSEREIIHQAIDLFEEHMAAVTAEATKVRKNRKGSKPSKDEKNANYNNLTVVEAEKGKDDVFSVPEGKNERDEDSKPLPRSKQIVPVPFDFEEENEEEVEKPSINKASQSLEEVRAGACPLEGRSLMRRMFPDIMGFVADHLWTAWSSPVRATNA